MNETEKVILEVELTDSEAFALAQFCKRLSYGEFRRNAVNETETEKMRNAQEKIYSELMRNGYNPR